VIAAPAANRLTLTNQIIVHRQMPQVEALDAEAPLGESASGGGHRSA